VTAQFDLSAVSETPTSIECLTQVADDLAFFDGHFDGFPVLAGVAQIDALVLELVGKRFPELGSLEKCSRIKFRQPISPGDELRVVVSRRDETPAVTFEIRRGETLCSDGRLHFRVGGVRGERRSLR